MQRDRQATQETWRRKYALAVVGQSRIDEILRRLQSIRNRKNYVLPSCALSGAETEDRKR